MRGTRKRRAAKRSCPLETSTGECADQDDGANQFGEIACDQQSHEAARGMADQMNGPPPKSRLIA